ncbi:MAG: putative Ig domain-containing protein, partial [Planctomycetota bacterium]|nr:putative Ig domain-containing protein [Planctomycetota bacterium]
VGTVVIRIQASDGHSGTASMTFELTVVNTNDAPTVAAPIADVTAAQGRAFGLQIRADAFSDADADVLALSATLEDGSPLPVWLTFDAQTRTFAGTPQAADAGTLAVRSPRRTRAAHRSAKSSRSPCRGPRPPASGAPCACVRPSGSRSASPTTC